MTSKKFPVLEGPTPVTLLTQTLQVRILLPLLLPICLSCRSTAPASSDTLPSVVEPHAENSPKQSSFQILGIGGGPQREFNEIAIEKNILYFQRTLKALDLQPSSASWYFAAGPTQEKTIRFQKNGIDHFKATEIPSLSGPSTRESLEKWSAQIRQQAEKRPLFLYFTGHGSQEEKGNPLSNHFTLWNSQPMQVREFTRFLEKIPDREPVVSVMTQCYAGGFSQFMYENADRKQGLAEQTRCGFFATVDSLPSTGCFHDPNELTYKDYSTSFFEALSGIDRAGKKTTPSADIDADGVVTFREAHDYTLVNLHTYDIPHATSDSWLVDNVPSPTHKLADWAEISVDDVMEKAQDNEKRVLKSLLSQLDLPSSNSFSENLVALEKQKFSEPQRDVILAKLQRVLLITNTVMRRNSLIESGDTQRLGELNRLQSCESQTLGQ